MAVERERFYSEEPLEGLRASLAHKLFKLGVVQFLPFSITLHEKYPDAPPSPVYLDFRRVLRDLSAKRNAVDVYEELFENFDFDWRKDLLSPVPTGATPFVSSLQDRLGAGMIMPRKDKKTHGIQTDIDGIVEGDQGKRVVVVDDTISQAISSLKVVEMVRNNDYVVTDVVCLVDRELFGKEKLVQAGCRVHPAMTLTQLLSDGRREGLLDDELYTDTLLGMQDMQEYLKDK